MSDRQKPFIGWIKDLGLIDPNVLQPLLDNTDEKDYIGQKLVDQQLITEATRDKVLSLQKLLGSSKRLSELDIEPATLALIPLKIVLKHQLLPIMKIENKLILASVETNNPKLMEELNQNTGLEIVPISFRLSDIHEAARKLYGPPSTRKPGLEWINDEWSELGPHLTFVGSGDAQGSGARNQTCLHIQSEEATFLIDCGPTSLTAMKQMGISVNELDGILLTHAHGDHFGGTPFVLLEQMCAQRTRPFWIMAAPHLIEHVKAFNELCYPNLFEHLTYPIEYLSIESQPKSLPNTTIMVYPFAMNHQSDRVCFGYQVHLAEGKIVAYTGDTAWCNNLESLARDTDVFVCECSYYNQGPEEVKHMSYQEILQKKDQLKTKRLILTHMGDEMLAKTHESIFETAYDGYVVDL